jgi:hypothetical protein
MNINIERLLADKERELEVYISGLNDPRLRELLSDLAAIRRTNALAVNSEQGAPAQVAPLKVTTSPVVNQNGHQPPTATLTQGDAVVEILRKAGRPLHINDIAKEMPSFGLNPKKQNLVSIIVKDRKDRFTKKGGNVFALRPGYVSSQPSPTNGSSPFARAGFSLIGSVMALLPQLHAEFSQPVVYNMLRERHPEVAEHIQKASVATTLTKLAERGLIEVTDKGFGSEPRKYKSRVRN